MAISASSTISLNLDSSLVAKEIMPVITRACAEMLGEITKRTDLLTIEEAAEFLKISGPTLSKYTREGKFVKHTVPGTGLIRYKRSELESSLVCVEFKVGKNSVKG